MIDNTRIYFTYHPLGVVLNIKSFLVATNCLLIQEVVSVYHEEAFSFLLQLIIKCIINQRNYNLYSTIMDLKIAVVITEIALLHTSI